MQQQSTDIGWRMWMQQSKKRQTREIVSKPKTRSRSMLTLSVQSLSALQVIITRNQRKVRSESQKTESQKECHEAQSAKVKNGDVKLYEPQRVKASMREFVTVVARLQGKVRVNDKDFPLHRSSKEKKVSQHKPWADEVTLFFSISRSQKLTNTLERFQTIRVPIIDLGVISGRHLEIERFTSLSKVILHGLMSMTDVTIASTQFSNSELHQSGQNGNHSTPGWNLREPSFVRHIGTFVMLLMRTGPVRRGSDNSWITASSMSCQHCA
eukprot:3394276-Amphidinium_carterae.1